MPLDQTAQEAVQRRFAKAELQAVYVMRHRVIAQLESSRDFPAGAVRHQEGRDVVLLGARRWRSAVERAEHHLSRGERYDEDTASPVATGDLTHDGTPIAPHVGAAEAAGRGDHRPVEALAHG